MKLDEICQIDPAKDAAISVQATVTNLTTGYTLKPAYGFQLTNVDSSYAPKSSMPVGGRILVAKVFSEGDSRCMSASASGSSNGYGINFWDERAAGESTADQLYLVIKDYFSPAAQSGDSTLLTAYGLRPLPSQNGDGIMLSPEGSAPIVLLNGFKA